MMQTTYNVRIWSIRERRYKTKTTYFVRWRTESQTWEKPFATKALAESFRADLLAAAKKGEAFVLASGLPVSMHRTESDLSWLEFARQYVDEKWPTLAANSRRNTAYSLSIATLALLRSQRGKPSDVLLNKALAGWAFNVRQRNDRNQPDDVADALRWLASNTRPVADLATDPSLVRSVIGRLGTNANGAQAAPDTVLRRRGVLHDALNRAAERKLLGANPMDEIKSSAPRAVKEVDTRVVANPIQARTLLRAVEYQKPNGLRWLAFFALMYYAGLRPEEAVGLRKTDLSLPEKGWGELHLERSAPVTGRPWSDTEGRRDDMPLKHRAKGATRSVPCHPELTRILHEYLDAYGTADDGRLFRALNDGEVGESTYYRVWRRAREEAFTKDVAATRLAKRPYDLRHACVSTWLTGGVAPTQVAKWAGHSVTVLLQIYAKCLDGHTALDRKRIEDALGGT